VKRTDILGVQIESMFELRVSGYDDWMGANCANINMGGYKSELVANRSRKLLAYHCGYSTWSIAYLEPNRVFQLFDSGLSSDKPIDWEQVPSFLSAAPQIIAQYDASDYRRISVAADIEAALHAKQAKH
jgi:hypothetical protein